MKFFSIRNKVFSYTSLVTTLALITFGVVIYVLFFNTLKDNALDHMTLESQKTKEELEIFFKMVVTTGSHIATDEEILTILNPEAFKERDEGTMGDVEEKVNEKLRNMLKSASYINNIFVIPEAGDIYRSEFLVNKVALRSFYGREEGRALSEDYYYTPVHDATYLLKPSDVEIVSYVRPIFNKAGNRVLGTLVIDIKYNFIKNMFTTESVKNKEKVLVISSDGQSIYAYPYINFKGIDLEELAQMEPSPKRSVSILGEDSYVVTSTLNYTKWQIIRIIPVDIIAEDIRPIGGVVMVITLTFVALAFIVSYKFSKSLTKPIEVLNTNIKQVESGNLEVNVKLDNKDELGELSHSFNEMTSRLKQLIEDRVDEEKKKSEMEFRVLQSQINPHFLYNTLDSVKWLAVIQDADNIAEMVTSLIHLLKYNISKNDYSVALKEEVDNVRNYVNIQKYRYGDVFQVTYDLETISLDCRVLRFMLQPIVENAIFHAFEDIEEAGEITISSQLSNGTLYIRIKDNGVGMDSEDSFSKIEKKNMFSGIGLKNIDERIKLYFGQAYGLDIFSKEGEGTEVQIILPIDKIEEYE